jgi:hypothetical protein
MDRGLPGGWLVSFPAAQRLRSSQRQVRSIKQKRADHVTHTYHLGIKHFLSRQLVFLSGFEDDAWQR